jgi:dipeptidyl aminopeptidase/acylaminoacyl peptidase
VPTDWLSDGSTVLLFQLHRGTGALWLHDVESGVTTPLHTPPGAPLSWGRPFLLGRGAAASIWSSAEMPWSVVRMTRDGSDVLLGPAGGSHYPGAAWTEVTFPSTEGFECQGWLLRPSGDGPWPAIVSAHGGPTAVVSPGFSAIGQAWADHGYAFLTVNYRGSTTFGDAYREALTGRVGEVDVDDLVAARRWLVESGVARPDLVILNGWSWGGYLTLQTMGTNPGLWAAGIAGAPVADWAIATEDQQAGLDAYDRALFGTDIGADPESRLRASPRTHVARFDAPVLITTPREDSRTPIRQIEAFVDDMRAAGKEIRLDVVAGGHAGMGPDHWIGIMESWLNFAGEVRGRVG